MLTWFRDRYPRLAEDALAERVRLLGEERVDVGRVGLGHVPTRIVGAAAGRMVRPMSGAPAVASALAGGKTREETWSTFAAIDFETANSSRDSACAMALVRVEAGDVAEKRRWLIRPPTATFYFTAIHGISWSDVRNAPTFADVWSEAARFTADVGFLAAHNASFDRSVLAACSRRAGLHSPTMPFRCTVQLARRSLGIYPTTLPDVCRRLGIPLRHHDALSDAEACARIVLAVGQASGGTFR